MKILLVTPVADPGFPWGGGDSRLAEENIKDGNTVNIVIEPENDVEVEVQCGPKIYKHVVNHCMTIEKFKMLLIESNEVVFLLRDFVLIANKDIEEELELDDDSMSLHYYTSDTSLKLKAVGPTIFVTTQDSFGTQVCHNILRKTTVSDLKEVIKNGISSVLPKDLSENKLQYSTLGELSRIMTCMLPSNKTDKRLYNDLYILRGIRGLRAPLSILKHCFSQ